MDIKQKPRNEKTPKKCYEKYNEEEKR